jgi:hypothetical protein
VSQSLILLLPLLVLSAVALFAFAGCTPFGTEPTPPEPTPIPIPTPQTYEDVVRHTTGLIAYWRLDEAHLPGQAYPAAHDTGGVNTGLDGTFHGAVGLAGVPGALARKEATDRGTTFDGSSYVEVPFNTLLSPPLSFSLEVWIQPGALSSPGTEQHAVAFRDVAGSVNRGFEINLKRTAGMSEIHGRVGTGGGAEQAVEARLQLDDANLGPGADWRHLVMTYDGANPSKPLTLYVNGDASGPEQTKTNVTYGRNVQQPLRIGGGRAAGSPDAAQFYVGAIDEVALYGVALDAATVKMHYALSGR